VGFKWVGVPDLLDGSRRRRIGAGRIVERSDEAARARRGRRGALLRAEIKGASAAIPRATRLAVEQSGTYHLNPTRNS